MFGFRKKSIHEDAKTFFEEQLKAVQIILYKYFEDIFKKVFLQEGIGEEDAGICSAQVTNYLLAENLDEKRPDVTEETMHKINLLKYKVPDWAKELMGSDKTLRELVVYTLRMKFIYLQYFKGTEFLHSPDGKRIEKLLNTYGEEFQKEPSPKEYSGLIKRAILNANLREKT